jgi:flagellar biosynthesis protein FlhB
MDETELDKSEQASPFKLKRAREKGTVARGIDLGFFTALIAFLAFAWINGPEAAVAISRMSGVTLSNAASTVYAPSAMLSQAALLFSIAVRPLLLLAATVFCVVLLFEFLQVGPVFSFQSLKPDFSRINPAKGLKRIFSWRLFVEAMKSVLKLAIYGTVAWLTINATLVNDALGLTDAVQLVDVLARSGFRLLFFFALTAMFFATGDQILSRREFAKKMRMSRREMKRENRDREGDQRLKSKRKEFHNEFVKMAKSLRNARGSDVILTNPTHFAVALRYDPAKMEAPMIVSRGTGQLAERIRTIGFTYGVTIVQDAPLARALFKSGILEGEIPDALYQAVADLYRARRLLEKGLHT